MNLRVSGVELTALEFAQQTFNLHPAGVLLWPTQEAAIVADLHLEKGSFFAMQGQMLPPHDSQMTLEKLLKILDEHPVKQLLLLGDSFHDADGYYRLNAQSKRLFDALCQHYAVTWVMGNHDAGFVPKNVRAVDTLIQAGITFRHEAESSGTHEISGHFHPKARVNVNKKRITRPCFIHDQQRLILPAFGALTGGLDVHHEAIQSLFNGETSVELLGEHKLFSVPFKRTSPIALA